MAKSLEMKSDGLDFDRFMKAVVRIPKDKIDKVLEKEKSKRGRAKQGTPSPSRNGR